MQEMQETQFLSLGRENPLEQEMATHFSVLAWEIPWTEEPGGLQSMGSQKSDTTEQLGMQHAHTPYQAQRWALERRMRMNRAQTLLSKTSQ